jgi:hypothetical protein
MGEGSTGNPSGGNATPDAYERIAVFFESNTPNSVNYSHIIIVVA